MKSVKVLALLVSMAVSGSVFADSFNDATQAARAAHDALNQAISNSATADANSKTTNAAYNDVTSNDGSGRFNADGSFSQSTVDAAEKARAEATNAHAAQTKAEADSMAADAAVSGSAMKAQVNDQQAAQIAADAVKTGVGLTKANIQRTRAQIVAGGVSEVNAQKQAELEAKGAALTVANQQRTQMQIDAKAAAESIANYGRKGNPNLTAQYSQSTQQVDYSGTSTRPATGSINVAASTLSPSTKVSATVNGKTVSTTAGELAKVAPQIQVSIPHVDAIINSPVHSSNGHDKSNNSSEHGTGNGGNNAANTNSAHGLGGGDHIGGGRSGGGFHY